MSACFVSRVTSYLIESNASLKPDVTYVLIVL